MTDPGSSLQKIRIDGHTLAALAFNPGHAGTPMIFIHGLVDSIYGWAVEQIPFFTERPWYSLSLPGHYPATFPPGFKPQELSAERIAMLTHQAITALLGDCPFILVGHSTGGFTALATAIYQPHNLRAVCSISGFACGRWSNGLAFLQWLVRRGRVGRILFDGLLNALKLGQPLTHPGARGRRAGDLRPGLSEWIVQNATCFRKLDTQSIAAWFWQMPEIDITPQLPQIQVPTLVIYGNRDPAVSPNQSRVIAATVPNCEKAEFAGVQHLPTTERAMLYEQILTAWLKRVES
jgi:pimeloyl-ACP methyl ester carboxylesterase